MTEPAEVFADTVLTVTSPDERLYAALAEAGFGEELFNERQHRLCELVDRYVFHLVLTLVRELGLLGSLKVARNVDEIITLHGFSATFAPALRWLLERLTSAGLVSKDISSPRQSYRLIHTIPAARLDVLRAAVLKRDIAYAPTLALLDQAAAIYPRVARGEISGEEGLFQKVALWCAYFSNTNPYYALNNRMAAKVAEARLPAAATVVEVGAGLGSAAEALLDRLRETERLGAVAAYHATEPVVFFRRRAERAILAAWSGVPLRFAALDLNAAWEPQGVKPQSVDLVWAVNVFHLARVLDGALQEAFGALVPGGWLVLGEGLRPFAGQVVGAEFPFQLLRSFVEVETHPEHRPTHGFLMPEQWVGALQRNGFETVQVFPDLARIRDIFPGFFAGVVCGRRPLP